MKKLIVAIFFMFQAVYSHSQVPSFYNQVDHVIWVVQDLAKVKAGWEQTGFSEIKDYGKISIQSSLESGSNKALMATASLGGLQVIWLQPLKQKGPLAKFINQHGDGIYCLAHATNGQADLMREVDRMRRNKVLVELRLTVKYKSGVLEYVLFDTKEQGKYQLGLVKGVESSQIFGLGDIGVNTYNLEFSQFAFAITNPGPVSEFWSGIGFPALSIDHAIVRDKMYKGKPANFDMNLGWQRHGNIPYEWCIPLSPPNVYEDFINVHGEGLQHFGFNVKNMDEVVAAFDAKGFHVVQSGAWGEEGQPGSGRFAYIGTASIGGVLMELLWSYE